MPRSNLAKARESQKRILIVPKRLPPSEKNLRRPQAVLLGPGDNVYSLEQHQLAQRLFMQDQ